MHAMEDRHRSAMACRTAGATLALGLSVAALTLLWATARAATPAEGWLAPGQRSDEMLLVLIAWAGTGLAGWLALGWALTLASAVPGAVGRWSGRLAERLTPALV